MSPELGIAIMMNNYFHDVATALLASSGVAMWLMARATRDSDPGGEQLLVKIYGGMTRLALVSVVWIILGGIPRTIFYENLEWSNAAGKGQVPALVVKHIVMFVLLGIGIAAWLKLRAWARSVRERGAAGA